MNYFSLLLLVGIILTTMELLLPTNFFIFSLGISFILGSFFSLFIRSLSSTLIFISFISITLFFLMKRLKIFGFAPKYDTNRDAYIGKQVTIEKKIDKGRGLTKIYSEIWVCKSEHELEENDICIVKDILGNTFIVEKEGKND